VRALALNQLTSSNTLRVFVREFRIALVNGTCLGLLLGVAVSLIFRSADLGIVIALAMVINNLVAGIFGVLVPVTLDKLRVDPAVSSAVFVTMATDVMGFFSFLGLAALWGLGG
jgi:magnesium transporter